MCLQLHAIAYIIPSMAAAPRIEANSRKRTLPDDALIYREYVHQVMKQGERGAKARTAAVCRVSHTHVANVIARYGPQPKDESTSYDPAPGEVEYMQNCAISAAQIADDCSLCQLIEEPIETPAAEVMATPSSNETETPLPIETPEREELVVAYQLLRNGVDRTRENQKLSLYLILGAVILFTALDIVIAQKSLLLALILLPEVMGMWWVILQYRRVVYLGE